MKGSSATRAAERFFKERRVKVHFVDLSQRPMSKGEIGRFVQEFGLEALIDTQTKAYRDSHLEYLRVTEEGLLEKIAAEPRLLKLPPVRSGNLLSVGQAEAEWKKWVSGT
ncbi:Regulatory protein Spx [Calidithermus terrae]|uniref:Regulatory protein Spx n=1 Tax=Calidithermus terrae TaxID=1408545 RepID=A0A399ERE1_9DEIN|nr:ArsC/Spx/MgsR family protein [Calidithermus terrae]RIH85609.1 Regulatory protein Spx [Calidithermus terrae]